jgi:hypothetical protein
VRVTSSTVSLGAGAYFHLLTAATPLSARMGLPPRISTLLTDPLGRTVAFKRHTPPTCARRRTSGYSGLEDTTTLRPDFSALCASNGAGKTAAEQNASARTANASLCGILARLSLFWLNSMKTPWPSPEQLKSPALKVGGETLRSKITEVLRRRAPAAVMRAL